MTTSTLTTTAPAAASLVTRILHLPITSDATAFETVARATERVRVHLGEPAAEHRDDLAGFVVRGIEHELERLGAAPPGFRATGELEASLGDQLYRARLLGCFGLAVSFGALKAIADARGQLSAADSATLRQLAELAEREPLQLYVPRSCAELHIIGNPEPLGGWLPTSPEPGRVASIEYDLTSDGLGADQLASDDEPAVGRGGEPTLVPPRLEAFLDQGSALTDAAPSSDAALTDAAPSSDALSAGSAVAADATEAADDEFASTDGAGHAGDASDLHGDVCAADEEADAVDEDEDGDADGARAALRTSEPELTGARASEPPFEEDERQLRSAEAPASASAAARRAEALSAARDAARSAARRAVAPSSARSAARRAEARDITPEPAAAAPAAAAPSAPAPAAPVPSALDPERIQRCMGWAAQLQGMSGPKVHGSVEKAFITAYLPLCREVSAGTAPDAARAVAERWAEGFAQSYAAAFHQLHTRTRRPRMVKDVVDLGFRWLGQHPARQCQLLLVSAMRFDLGQRLNEEIERRFAGGAVCAEQCMLWSALPSNAESQQLLPMEPRGMRRGEAPRASSDGPAIETLHAGNRQLFRLGRVLHDLPKPGEVESARLTRLAAELADSIVPWMQQQPPDTLIVVFGDHGFHWQSTPSSTSAAQRGGALPEQVLVSASAWLPRPPRPSARNAPGLH